MSNNPAIAAVVVSFNGERWISACLKSLAESAAKPAIIVVDNNSSDNTAAIVARDFPGATLIRNKTNLGFGEANNIGIREALGRGVEGVFLLNQDATVEPGAIEKLSAIAAATSGAGIVAPLHMAYDGSGIDQHVIGYLSGDAPKFFDDLFKAAPQETYEISFFPAAGWLIHRRALEVAGGFDPLFFMYGEDKDYCARVRRAGLHVLLAPGAKIRHWHGGPPEKTAPRADWIEKETYWQLVLWLKNPDSPFMKNVVCAVREELLRMMRDVAYLDIGSYVARARAFRRVLFRLGTIKRHRELEKTPRLFL